MSSSAASEASSASSSAADSSGSSASSTDSGSPFVPMSSTTTSGRGGDSSSDADGSSSSSSSSSSSVAENSSSSGEAGIVHVTVDAAPAPASARAAPERSGSASSMSGPQFEGAILSAHGEVLRQSLGASKLDPISLDSFAEPVVTVCGHVYSAESIIEWLKENTTCPLCRRNLRDTRLLPANEVRRDLGLPEADGDSGEFTALLASLGYTQPTAAAAAAATATSGPPTQGMADHDPVPYRGALADRGSLRDRCCNCTRGGRLLPRFASWGTYVRKKDEGHGDANWCGNLDLEWGEVGACCCSCATICAIPCTQSSVRSFADLYCHLTLGEGSSYCSRSVCGTCCPCWVAGYVGVCIFQLLVVILSAILCFILFWIIILTFPIWIIPVCCLCVLAIILLYVGLTKYDG